MPYIYKITNQINGKVYIGKTLTTVQKRWNQHLTDRNKETCKNRPIYRAINKYGPENFVIEKIEECSEDIINDRECFWIETYNSFKNGYNATIGGDGKAYIDRTQVISLYQQGYNCKEVAKIMSIGEDTVSKILKNNNIVIKSGQEVQKTKFSKGVLRIKDNDIIYFNSVHDAANELIKQNIAKGQIKGVTVHIRQVCDKKRKTAYGFKWQWA